MSLQELSTKEAICEQVGDILESVTLIGREKRRTQKRNTIRNECFVSPEKELSDVAEIESEAALVNESEGDSV